MDYRRVGRLWGRPHRVVGIGYRRASADGIRRSDVFWPCVRWIRDERERGGGIGICGWLGGNYNTISEFTAEHDGAAGVERYRGMLRGGV